MTRGQRLAEFVRAGRIARGFPRQEDLSAAIGVSVRTIGKIEAGQDGRYSARTKAALEFGLGWMPGSVDQILNGGRPRRWESDPDLAMVINRWPKLTPAARRGIRRLAEEITA